MPDNQSMFGWYGGKYHFIEHILPFPEHLTYVEVFCGSAIILLNKVPSAVEIANDKNARLINAWIAIQKFRRQVEDWCLHEGGLDSEELFCKYRDEMSKNPIEDAMRMLYVNHHSFSQNNKDVHGLSFTGKQHWHTSYLSAIERIDEVWKRIKNVIFRNKDFRNIVPRCDKKGVLMYLDPPYFKGGEVYENMSGREEGASWGMTDFYDLREQLTNLKNAHFVLSIDQADFWLETMPNLHVTPVERVNAASFCVGGEKKRDIEYVIRNFNPEEVKTMDYYSKKNKIADDMEI